MTHRINDLLLWISARGSGTWRQFRAAVEEFQPSDAQAEEQNADFSSAQKPFSQHLHIRQQLERLGHVEFFTGSDWRVTPPTLAHTANGHSHAVLSGARTPRMLEYLERHAAVTLRDDVPDVFIFTGNIGQLREITETLNLHFQENAGIAVLQTLPAVDDPGYWEAAALPIGVGWEADRFCAPELVWRTSSRLNALAEPGAVFRFHLGHERRSFFCTNGATFRVDTQTGKYLSTAGRCHVLQYDEPQLRLSLPAIMRPPLLVERALILGSGLPPAYDPRTRTLQYTNVPKEVFILTQLVLSQEQ